MGSGRLLRRSSWAVALAGAFAWFAGSWETPHPAVDASDEDAPAFARAAGDGAPARVEPTGAGPLGGRCTAIPGGGERTGARRAAARANDGRDVFRSPDEVRQRMRHTAPLDRLALLDALARTMDASGACAWEGWLRTRYVVLGFLTGNDAVAVHALAEQLAAQVEVTTSESPDPRRWLDHGMFRGRPFRTWRGDRAVRAEPVPSVEAEATFVESYREAAVEFALCPGDDPWGYPEVRRFLETRLERVAQHGPVASRDLAEWLRRYVRVSWDLQMVAELPGVGPEGGSAHPALRAAAALVEGEPRPQGRASILHRALEGWLWARAAASPR